MEPGTCNTENQLVRKWVEEMAALCQPDRVYWCDGSDREKETMLREAVSQGVLIPLNQEKLPGCYLHRSNPTDVARVADRTFVCSPRQDQAGPTNNWAPPREMYQ